MDCLEELIAKTRHDRLVVVEQSMEELEENPITDYIKRRLKTINLKELSKRFDLEVTYPLVFPDIETTGLTNTFSIVSLAYSVLSEDGKLTSTCLFPPTYRLEREAIEYFFENLGKEATLFTWNGTTFDIPRISDRARQRGVVANGSPAVTFKDHIQGRHIDLYRLRKEFDLPKEKDYGKLQTIERVIFGYERRDDIHGRRIPEAYREWVYSRSNPQEVAKIIIHNIQDTVTPIAVMLKLCDRSKQPLKPVAA